MYIANEREIHKGPSLHFYCGHKYNCLIMAREVRSQLKTTLPLSNIYGLLGYIVHFNSRKGSALIVIEVKLRCMYSD